MGTRADFYIGKGLKAKWVGSIAFDGYPDGITPKVRRAKTPAAFKLALKEFFKDRDDVTLPEQGWPWPWEDSGTTDYYYCFFAGKVHVSPDMPLPQFDTKAHARPNDNRSGIMMIGG